MLGPKFVKLTNRPTTNWPLLVFGHLLLLFLLPGSVISSGLERNFFSQTMVHKSPSHCYREVGSCVPMNSSQCLDVTLPYRYTYFSHLTSSSQAPSSSTNSSLSFEHHESLAQINHYLARWKGLRSIPQCWKALQSVLCASFFPRCDNELKHISLPTHEMCLLTRGPCRIIDLYYEWPEFLRCDNQTLFPSKCQNEYTDLKFNISSIAVASRCASPLVSTDDKTIWYPGIDSCALRCYNPIYTDEQHQKASTFIGYGTMFSVAFTGFAVFTFFIDWKSSNRYPAIIIFYLNACVLVATLGWAIQFWKGKSEIVCRPDNTARYGEPSKPDNFLCTFSFLLIYYFSFAALIWFVQLAYVCDFLYKKTDAPRIALQTKSAYFHLTAWSIPLILTIFILLIGEIDGDSMHGICFVGFVKPMVRIIFVFVPLTIGVTLGLYYMVKSILLLYRAKQINDRSTTVNSEQKSQKICRMMVRITGFAIYVLLALIVSFGSYLHQLHTADAHRQSLNDFIICNLNISNTPVSNSKTSASMFPSTSDGAYIDLESTNCHRQELPSMTNFYLQLTVCFATSFITSSWVWTTNSVASWKRFMNRCFNNDYSNRSVRLKPYETIAKSYLRRQQINQGTYIPSFNSNHNDPVDMDLNSALSQSLSLNFRDNFGALLARRGGLPGNEALNSVIDSTGITNAASIGMMASYHNHRSVASVSNLSISDVSQQQLSIDSQLSAEQIELAAIVRHQRRKTKKERERFRQIHARMMRRGSDTSGSLAAFAAANVTNNAAAAAAHVTNKKQGGSAVTKSTSTGDLSSLPNGLPNPIRQPPPPILNSGFPFMNPLFPFGGMMGHQQQIHPMMQNAPPPIAAYSQSDHLMHNNKFGLSGMGFQFAPNVNMGFPLPNGFASVQNNTRVAPPRMKPSQLQNSFTFTHGMSDQANQLVNPLEEIRRPDSSFAPTPTITNSLGPNLIVTKSGAAPNNGHTVNGHNSCTGSPFSTGAANGTTNSMANNGGNFFLNSFAANQMAAAAGAANMLGPSMASCNPARFMFNPAMPHSHSLDQKPQQFGPGLAAANGKQPNGPFPYNPAMQPINPTMFGHQMNGATNGLMENENKYAEALQYYNYCWHATSYPELPPHLVNPPNPPQNLAELDKLIRERQHYHQRRQESMYDSDINEYFPIVISDSEGMFSDSQQSGAEGGGRDSSNRKRFQEQIADTKKMVEDRIQQVEELAKQTIQLKTATIGNGIEAEQEQKANND